MINPETRAEIRRYFFAEHWKIGTIARELSVHPDAVRHAIESDRFRRGPALHASILDPVWSKYSNVLTEFKIVAADG